MRLEKTMGDCPRCQDQLELYRTNSRKRFIKCANPECNLSYAIPQYGTVEYMGVSCPESGLPILFITKKAQDVRYFWVESPCFTCRKGSTCEPLMELREEFEMEVKNP